MFRILGPVLALLLLVGTALGSGANAERIGDADHGGRPLSTTMTGAAEVNASGVPNQGDPDGSGTALITLNPGQGEICWELQVSGIALPATAAHIHIAPIDRPGPVVLPLSAPDASGFSSGCATASRELVKAILQNPEAYYVNVHTTEYPAGAVRGQLG